MEKNINATSKNIVVQINQQDATPSVVPVIKPASLVEEQEDILKKMAVENA